MVCLAHVASSNVGCLAPITSSEMGYLALVVSSDMGCLAPIASSYVGCLTPEASSDIGCLAPAASFDMGCLASVASSYMGCLAPVTFFCMCCGVSCPSFLKLYCKDPKFVKAEYQPKFPAPADKRTYQKEGRKIVKVKDLKPKRIKGYLEYKFSQRSPALLEYFYLMTSRVVIRVVL
ncbi:hypothetical protein GQ457_01G019170 [Hibiscus cannabinus]